MSKKPFFLVGIVLAIASSQAAADVSVFVRNEIGVIPAWSWVDNETNGVSASMSQQGFLVVETTRAAPVDGECGQASFRLSRGGIGIIPGLSQHPFVQSVCRDSFEFSGAITSAGRNLVEIITNQPNDGVEIYRTQTWVHDINLIRTLTAGSGSFDDATYEDAVVFEMGNPDQFTIGCRVDVEVGNTVRFSYPGVLQTPGPFNSTYSCKTPVPNASSCYVGNTTNTRNATVRVVESYLLTPSAGVQETTAATFSSQCVNIN